MNNVRSRLSQLDPSDIEQSAQKIGRYFQDRGVDFYLKLVTVILCANFMADVGAILLEKYIPDAKENKTEAVSFAPPSRTIENYDIIFSRNLFNSKGLIPGEEGAPSTDIDAPPVKSSLPLALIGTVILKDPRRSLGTIQDKTTNLVHPVRADDIVPGKIKVLEVEARKVIFINLGNNRKEFIDMPEDFDVGTPIISGAPQKKKEAIAKVSGTRFIVPRKEVDASIKDLNKVLTEARAVPNFENGVPSGYKLFQIVPGSIYDKLGLKNGDVISGLNGEPINDPGKAFEMLNELRNTTHLELNIKRNGKEETMIYDIQ